MANGINEIELQRLKNERHDIAPELVQFFANALESFVASGQYAVLKNLRLSFFIDEEVLDTVGFLDATFEELVNVGVYDVCSMESVDVELVETFVRLLEKMSMSDGAAIADIDPVLFAPPVEQEAPQTHGFRETPLQLLSKPSEARVNGRVGVIPGPVLNSIESEKKLREAFERVRAHPRRTEFEQETLGQYWQESWLRAPFLEALTFQQLLSMKISNILDKRTCNAQKVIGILKCVAAVCERYVDGYESVKVTTPIVDTVVQTNASESMIEADSGAMPSITWKKQVADSPILFKAVAQYFVQQVDEIALPLDLLKTLAAALDSQEAGMLLLTALGESLAAADAMGMAEEAFDDKLVSIQKRVSKFMHKENAESIKPIENLLKSPAVSLEVLFGLTADETSVTSISHLAAEMILLLLQATPAFINETQLENCWTANEKSLELVWKTIVSEAPRSKKAFAALCETFLPHVPESEYAAMWKEMTKSKGKKK